MLWCYKWHNLGAIMNDAHPACFLSLKGTDYEEGCAFIFISICAASGSGGMEFYIIWQIRMAYISFYNLLLVLAHCYANNTD